MLRVITTLAIATLAHAAVADTGSADFVQGYYGSSAEVSGAAAACGLRDGRSYNAFLSENLFAANVTLDGLLPAAARLTLSAEPFQQIGGRCVVVASLSFEIPLQATEIEVAADVSKRSAIVAVFEEMERVPAVLYRRTAFTVADANAGDAAAKTLITNLANQVGAGR